MKKLKCACGKEMEVGDKCIEVKCEDCTEENYQEWKVQEQGKMAYDYAEDEDD